MASLQESLSRVTAEVILDTNTIQAYRRDHANLVEPGQPLAVVLPRRTEEVVEVLQWATAHRVPVVPRGAGTGLAGGATAIDGGLVVCLSRMDTILEVDPVEQLAVVQPGVINADIGRAVAVHGLMYAPDPASWEISTIGGNLATNAGGLRCLKYGVTRDSVLGLEVVLTDGRVLRTGGRTVKHVTGYDLTGLFVGSEGTLGVITEAILRLRPMSRTPPVTVVASFPSLDKAGGAVAAVIEVGIQPSLLELLDATTIGALEAFRPSGLDGSAAALLVGQIDTADAEAQATQLQAVLTAGGASEVFRSTDVVEADMLLATRRLAYTAIERMGPTIVEDVGVPRRHLAEMFRRVQQASATHGVTIATLAHAGDGNLHPCLVVDPLDRTSLERTWEAAGDIFQAALDLGGTITGEHGVGTLKRPWLQQELGEDSLSVHRQIKTALDPLSLMNPGKAI